MTVSVTSSCLCRESFCRDGVNKYLITCSVHHMVCYISEKTFGKLPIISTFYYFSSKLAQVPSLYLK